MFSSNHNISTRLSVVSPPVVSRHVCLWVTEERREERRVNVFPPSWDSQNHNYFLCCWNHRISALTRTLRLTGQFNFKYSFEIVLTLHSLGHTPWTTAISHMDHSHHILDHSHHIPAWLTDGSVWCIPSNSIGLTTTGTLVWTLVCLLFTATCISSIQYLHR